jgi:hypothetical protein
VLDAQRRPQCAPPSKVEEPKPGIQPPPPYSTKDTK